jgi:hypothetical protein
MTTLITNKDGTTYETTIAQVVFKGCEIKPIGTTGYFSEKVPHGIDRNGKTSAPAIYRLRGPNNKVIDQYLSMASLKAGMVRRGLTTIKTKIETIAQAYERGYIEGWKSGYTASMNRGA